MQKYQKKKIHLIFKKSFPNAKERNSNTFEGIQYSSKYETFPNAKVSKKRNLTYIGRRLIRHV